MKLNRLFLLAACCGIFTAQSPVFAQITSFTYQGQLKVNGAPVTGNYDFIFSLYNTNGLTTQIGPAITNLDVPVTNGLFTTIVTNLAMTNFNIPNLALGLGVRLYGTTGSFTPLLPFQPLTPAPYAIAAANVTGTVQISQLSGTIPLAQLPANLLTNNSTNVVLSGAFTGNGAGLTNLAQTAAAQPTITPILNMIWINPGTFVLGSPNAELNRNANEGPQTTVSFTNGFWMCHHLVTQGEYAAVMTNSNPSSFTGNLYFPVDSVTWLNASNFCSTLTTREQAAGRLPVGWTYRLPTEAEWEYSCRALTTTVFYWGADPNVTNIVNFAWYMGDTTSSQPVGQKLANPWGLVDMSGNLFEWCGDWLGTYPGGSLINPTGATNGTARVLRGGSWNSPFASCRSAARTGSGPTTSFTNVGFRVVLAPN